ncbi:AMP-binding protein [Acinetobacter faecalis]|uniref:AMP-binding protein n=1 Tax=Acinetobacter faecalis TaxID=2665161 RepID=UPI002A920204|nr:AMP-binding protein [Acinetobacter faecalis]MDY6482184.1 AMP-binding protein [Acinetobacter faecalis]
MSCYFENYVNSPKLLCIKSDLSTVSFASFWQDVAEQQAQIEQLETETWALWEQDSYEFLVLLFAALNAKKQVLLPPNRISDLEKELAEQNIYFLTRQTLQFEASQIFLKFDQNFLEQSSVYFYTSGSTGQPKKIPRTLAQLFNEVAGLNESFELPEQAVAIATVSHQHIYGLLFKLLWPLASGRSFYQNQVAFPEDVVDVEKKIAHLNIVNYVISSPALLKRWTTDVVLQECITVYSSGGKLDSGIRPFVNVPITEVFGSSETGGIAHRREDEALWTPFANVEIRQSEQQELAVKANHACTQDWILTGDKIELVDLDNLKSPFKLLGRLDRIIKLEEKRLSLDAIEHKILELDDVSQCHVLVVEKEHRQMLACVVVLTNEAREKLVKGEKSTFVANIKAKLKDKLESIAIPRQWRFITQLPQNAQAKLNKQYLKSLFQPMLLPVVLEQKLVDVQAQFELEFTPELECFKGHFPTFPIFPGVGQVGFVQHFAKQTWADLQWCNGFEQLKFQELIYPYSVVQLKLTRKLHKISFEILGDDKTIASGRLLFALQEEA